MTAEQRYQVEAARIRMMGCPNDSLCPRFPEVTKMPNKRQGPAVRRNLRAHGYLSKRSNAL